MTARPLHPVAIVTGAARNIGRAIALALAGEGARVMVSAQKDLAGAEETASLIKKAGGQAAVELADVADEAAVARLVSAAAERLGPPSILVNNAALRRGQPFLETSLADWRKVISINLEGAFLCARSALPYMIEAGWGRIISIGGRSGHSGASERAHVVASKSALVGLTKAIAVEFGAKGVTANLVVPGDIDTVRGASAGPLAAHASHGNLVGRLGKPEEIAGLVAYLCRDEAAYVTGQTLHCNGGGYLP